MLDDYFDAIPPNEWISVSELHARSFSDMNVAAVRRALKKLKYRGEVVTRETRRTAHGGWTTLYKKVET